MLAERDRDRRYPLAYQAAGAQVVAAEGQFDLPTVHAIEQVAAATLRRDRRPIVIDLTAVNASGDLELSALFAALRRLRRRGASIAIAGAKPDAPDLFDAAVLEGVTLTRSVREALISLDYDRPPAARRRRLSLSPGGGSPISSSPSRHARDPRRHDRSIQDPYY